MSSALYFDNIETDDRVQRMPRLTLINKTQQLVSHNSPLLFVFSKDTTAK